MTVYRLCAAAHAFSSTWNCLGCHGIEPCEQLEKFFVDASLTKSVELGAEIRERLTDVAICALHGSKATRVFTG